MTMMYFLKNPLHVSPAPQLPPKTENQAYGIKRGSENTLMVTASGSNIPIIATALIVNFCISAIHVMELLTGRPRAPKNDSLFRSFHISDLFTCFDNINVHGPNLGAGNACEDRLWHLLPTYRTPFEITINDIFFAPIAERLELINILKYGFTGD